MYHLIKVFQVLCSVNSDMEITIYNKKKEIDYGRSKDLRKKLNADYMEKKCTFFVSKNNVCTINIAE